MSISDILFGKVGETADLFIYQVFGQVVAALFAPYLTEILNEVNSEHPVVPLTPGELAQMVLRGYMQAGPAAEEAKKSGLDPEKFDLLWRANGLPIAPQQAAEALRRGVLPEDSGDPNVPGYIQAIREGDLRDIWADTVKQLAVQWPSPMDALQALLEGQIEEAEARDLYHKFGGDPQFFQMLFDSRGNAPSPVEAGMMANRGIIPWDGRGPDSVAFEQAFLEGPWRNKWLEPMRRLSEYLPPPRTVTALLRNNSITDAVALELFKKTGLSTELATAYVNDAHHEKTAKDRALAQGTIIELYRDSIIPASEAETMLKSLGYDDAEAAFIIAIEDTRRYQQQLNAVISKLRSLFISRKIDEPTTLGALGNLGIQARQITEIMTVWKLEYAANVRIPTEAQIVSAWYYQIIDQSTAQQELEYLGFSAHDAWLLLSVRNKGPLPSEPENTQTTIQ